jgi:hypothetical protein
LVLAGFNKLILLIESKIAMAILPPQAGDGQRNAGSEKRSFDAEESHQSSF